MNITLGHKEDIFTMGEKAWAQNIKKIMPEYIRIIGRVIGRVLITDLGREVSYNQMIDIPASNARQSEDLSQAIANKWVDIVSGGEYLQLRHLNSFKQNSQVNQQPAQQTQQANSVSTDDLKEFAVQIAQSAANSAAEKSVASIKETLQVMSDKIGSGSNIDASQVVSEILRQLPKSQQDAQKVKIEDDAQNVFINLDQPGVLKSNISEGNLGELTVRKGDKARTTIKRLKQMKDNK